MPLVTETGAIVAGANTYVTLAELKSYTGTIPLPVTTDPACESALVNATRYIDGFYRPRWKGNRVNPLLQSLSWPRYGVALESASPVINGVYYGGVPVNNFLISTAIPQRLKDATCEAALRALTGPLLLDSDRSIQREKIDVIETTYFAGTAPGQLSYPVIDQLLSDYLLPRNGGDLVRG